MDSGLSTKVDKKGNPFIVQLKCDGEVPSTKSSDSLLPIKASRVNLIDTRTENRHRWARRVS